MTFRYRYPRATRPKPPPGAIQRGHRIVVVICDDTLNDPGPWGNDIILEHDAMTGQVTPIFHRAYVDKIEGSRLIFTACQNHKPFKRSRLKGSVRLDVEGTMWMQGWAEPTLAALAASYTLKDGTP